MDTCEWREISLCVSEQRYFVTSCGLGFLTPLSFLRSPIQWVDTLFLGVFPRFVVFKQLFRNNAVMNAPK